MTSTRYLAARLLASFGVDLSEKYRTAAAFETHLLRDAESVVGGLVWENVEHIEELSSEYWQLRKLSKKHQELETEIEQLSDVLHSAQEERTQAIESVSDKSRALRDERDGIADQIEKYHRDREDLQREGRAIKRSHAGLKTKLEVLLEEKNEARQPEVDSTSQQLKEYREEFESIKSQRDQLDKKISTEQEKLIALNKQLSEENSTIRQKAESQSGTIGKSNVELATLRNESAAIESKCILLHTHIGQFLIQNSKKPSVKQAAKNHRGLLSLTDEIRSSTNRLRSLFD